MTTRLLLVSAALDLSRESRRESAGSVTDCESAGEACRAGCAGCPRSAGAAPVRGAVCCACGAGCGGSSRLQHSEPSRLRSRRLESRRELASAVTDCESAGEACGAGCTGCPHSAAAAAAAVVAAASPVAAVRAPLAGAALTPAGVVGGGYASCYGGCGQRLGRVTPPTAIGGRLGLAALPVLGGRGAAMAKRLLLVSAGLWRRSAVAASATGRRVATRVAARVGGCRN